MNTWVLVILLKLLSGMSKISYGYPYCNAKFRPSFVPKCRKSCRQCEICANNTKIDITNMWNTSHYWGYTAEDFARKGIPGMPIKLDKSQCNEGCQEMICDMCNDMVDRHIGLLCNREEDSD